MSGLVRSQGASPGWGWRLQEEEDIGCRGRKAVGRGAIQGRKGLCVGGGGGGARTGGELR